MLTKGFWWDVAESTGTNLVQYSSSNAVLADEKGIKQTHLWKRVVGCRVVGYRDIVLR